MVSEKLATLLAACLTIALTHTVLIGRKELRSSGCLGAHLNKTLVVHIFADTDPEYLENLKFFIQYGIVQEDNADYIILVQTDSSTIVRAPRRSARPPLPYHQCVYLYGALQHGLCASRLPDCHNSRAMPSTSSTRTSAMTGGLLVGCFCIPAMST